ncbi:hypothetical protein pb186bvf_010576 [Paramecium bursaria]
MSINRKIIDGELFFVVNEKRICLLTLMEDNKYSHLVQFKDQEVMRQIIKYDKIISLSLFGILCVTPYSTIRTLQKRSLIFKLTQSLSEDLLKYIPSFFIFPLLLYNLKSYYREKLDQIADKYDFSDPDLQHAIKQNKLIYE